MAGGYDYGVAPVYGRRSYASSTKGKTTTRRRLMMETTRAAEAAARAAAMSVINRGEGGFGGVGGVGGGGLDDERVDCRAVYSHHAYDVL